MSVVVNTWLLHVSAGFSMRQIARLQAVAPSTVMRRIRWCEDLTDDPVRGPRLECLAEKARSHETLVRALILFAEIIAPQRHSASRKPKTGRDRLNDRLPAAALHPDR
ncbi:hypothetical protein OEZ60_15155 [Defluviimonas sp. WL0024]|uniref:Homeodomain-like domain-containing protein n=1 Tax=Albidovulum salinarum TaxID=2984153 RepID=A0ABT2XCC2_9RHOB|nr:hypothetical protein [Defluviimonas sp. WL0024]MCU9849340.1 hypothetical protein [Defluviimonas sp. WL0024]